LLYKDFFSPRRSWFSEGRQAAIYTTAEVKSRLSCPYLEKDKGKKKFHSCSHLGSALYVGKGEKIPLPLSISILLERIQWEKWKFIPLYPQDKGDY
jgi:hypothetical protein